MLVVLTQASTWHAGVVIVNVTAMGKAVVPILVPFYRQGGEAARGLMSSIASAAAAAVATIATTIFIAAATTAAVAATATVVVAIATVAATAAAAVVATAFLAGAASIMGASWLLLWGLACADCLVEHLKLSLDCLDVGSVRLRGFLGGSVGRTKGQHRIREQVCGCIVVGRGHAVPMLACRDGSKHSNLDCILPERFEGE
jgi:hypothetical protein